MGRGIALLLLLLFCLSAAAERKARRAPPCRENEGGDAHALCQSRGLLDSPICLLSDGRFVLAMRSEFGFEFTHALPGAYALARQGCVLHASFCSSLTVSRLLGATCGCGNGTAFLYTFSPAHWDSPDCTRRWKKLEAEALGWLAAPGRARCVLHHLVLPHN